MASTKKTPAQKISSAVENLLKTSRERREISDGLALAEGNETLTRILSNAKIRYTADVEYLRKNIIYNCGKLSEEMSDEAFDKFASGIRSLI